jgi:D-arginine utilization repressor
MAFMKVDSMNTTLSGYIPVADAIAKLLLPYAEVVIHDIEKDTIVHIANPCSRRVAGDKSHLGLVRDKFDFGLEKNVFGPYENTGKDGQRIRSITAVLRNRKAKPIGIICVNVDFSPLQNTFESALELLNGLISPPDTEARPEVIFREEWQERIKIETRTFRLEIGKPQDLLTTGERRELMLRMDEKRLFYARKSVEQVASLLNISRATAYKDLNQIRKEKNTTFPLF